MERSLMEQTGATDEQIRNAIDQGAIPSKQYFAQPQHVVSSLNRLRSTEIASYLQYKQHGYMAVLVLSRAQGRIRSTRRTGISPCRPAGHPHPATWRRPDF